MCFKMPIIDQFAREFFTQLSQHQKRKLLVSAETGGFEIEQQSLEFRNVIHYKPVAHNGMRGPKPRRV